MKKFLDIEKISFSKPDFHKPIIFYIGLPNDLEFDPGRIFRKSFRCKIKSSEEFFFGKFIALMRYIDTFNSRFSSINKF